MSDDASDRAHAALAAVDDAAALVASLRARCDELERERSVARNALAASDADFNRIVDVLTIQLGWSAACRAERDEARTLAAQALAEGAAECERLRAALRRFGRHEYSCPGADLVVTERVTLRYSEFMALPSDEKHARYAAGIVMHVVDDADGRGRFSTGSGRTGECACGFRTALAGSGT